MKVRDVIKKAEADGWRYVRTRGDHRVYHHPMKTGIVVAGHPGADVPTGMYQNILRQAGRKK